MTKKPRTEVKTVDSIEADLPMTSDTLMIDAVKPTHLRGMEEYEKMYKESIQNPQEFFGKVCHSIGFLPEMNPRVVGKTGAETHEVPNKRS